MPKDTDNPTNTEETKEAEEQVVEDTDADTKDVEDSVEDDYSAMSKRLARMEDAINRMSGVVTSIQKAQDSFVANGGVINEGPQDTETDKEGFLPLDKLDFSI